MAEAATARLGGAAKGITGIPGRDRRFTREEPLRGGNKDGDGDGGALARTTAVSAEDLQPRLAAEGRARPSCCSGNIGDVLGLLRGCLPCACRLTCSSNCSQARIPQLSRGGTCWSRDWAHCNPPHRGLAAESPILGKHKVAHSSCPAVELLCTRRAHSQGMVQSI